MKGLLTLSKYKYPELVALDILMQKAEAFNDQYHIIFSSIDRNIVYLSFNNGFKFLNISFYQDICYSKPSKNRKN